jgi:hypothetical protein
MVAFVVDMPFALLITVSRISSLTQSCMLITLFSVVGRGAYMPTETKITLFAPLRSKVSYALGSQKLPHAGRVNASIDIWARGCKELWSMQLLQQQQNVLMLYICVVLVRIGFTIECRGH